MSNNAIMAESSKIQWNIRSQTAEDNQADSTDKEDSSNEKLDSEAESSSDEGEYEVSGGTEELAESSEQTLKKSNLLDENGIDNTSDKLPRVLFSFGRLSFESEEPSENPLEKADLSDEKENRVDELPSEIVDRDFIYMPPEMEYFEERDEWKFSGKWLVFNHGDLRKLDSLWTGLRPLVESGTLVGLKCSTATDRINGVVMCYSPNCEDKKGVKMAADAIRRINDDRVIMYYKTNAATDSGFYRMYGDRFITKYMHTCAGSLYERDEYNRWKKVVFEENVAM